MTTVALVSRVPTVMVTSVSSGLADFDHLKSYMLSHPGKVAWGVTGIGTAPHLTEHVLTGALRAQVTEAQYRGRPPLPMALLAGHVDIVNDNYHSLKQPRHRP